MAELDELLEIDHKNEPLAKRTLDGFTPLLREGLEDAAAIFRTLSRSFGDGAFDADDARILKRELREATTDPQAYIRGLLVEPPAQPKPESIRSDDARAAIARIYSRRARAILKQLAFRSFAWAATDLQRFRVTAALAHTRVELEAVALMNVMMDSPEVAWRWFTIGPDEAGRRFFREHQARVHKILKSFDLQETYDWASSAASARPFRQHRARHLHRRP